VIKGEVEEFDYKPGAEIHIDENGEVTELARNVQWVIQADNAISTLEQRMEQYAGAPREAMGVRSPGEKTAFEVQSLENASWRIFQEKITQFELFMEELLNDMLEEAHRNFPLLDTIRIIDDDIGVVEFRELTKEDITADGILRPVGARHFAQKAQELQNLVGVMNSPMAEKLAPHISGIALSEFISDVMNLRGYKVFSPNIALAEAQETEALANAAMDENEMKQSVSADEYIASDGDPNGTRSKGEEELPE